MMLMSEGLYRPRTEAATSSEGAQEGLVRFPFVEDEKEYAYEDRPTLIENTIVHSTWSNRRAPEERRNRFSLQKTIGESVYILRLDQEPFTTRAYHLQMETDGYGFATTNLTPEQGTELFLTRASFIESFSDYTQVPVDEIESMPASTAYSVEDVKECIRRILAHENASHTREELERLSSSYQGARIFEAYHELFGEYFHGVHPNHMMSRARARSRLFTMMFKKYLKDWEVVEQPYTMEILLRRKRAAAT